MKLDLDQLEKEARGFRTGFFPEQRLSEMILGLTQRVRRLETTLGLIAIAPQLGDESETAMNMQRIARDTLGEE